MAYWHHCQSALAPCGSHFVITHYMLFFPFACTQPCADRASDDFFQSLMASTQVRARFSCICSLMCTLSNARLLFTPSAMLSPSIYQFFPFGMCVIADHIHSFDSLHSSACALNVLPYRMRCIVRLEPMHSHIGIRLNIIGSHYYVHGRPKQQIHKSKQVNRCEYQHLVRKNKKIYGQAWNKMEI